MESIGKFNNNRTLIKNVVNNLLSYRIRVVIRG